MLEFYVIFFYFQEYVQVPNVKSFWSVIWPIKHTGVSVIDNYNYLNVIYCRKNIELFLLTYYTLKILTNRTLGYL